MDLAFDRVTFELTGRTSVSTDTVRVFVRATVAGVEAGRVKETVSSALAPVLDGTWSIASASRSEGESGLERVQLTASIRVPEQLTGGLVERLRQANRPGVKLELVTIEYRPPHKQLEAARKELREELYRRAEEEVKVLNAVLPADVRPWRISAITIKSAETDSEATRRRLSHSSSYSSHTGMMGDTTDDTGALEAGVEIRLTANVTISRLSVPTDLYPTHS